MNSKLEYLVISLLGFLLISSNLTGQGIIGEVIDSQSDSALAYVNIGVIDLPVGTVSNESGKFELTCANLPQDSKVRISMIGYESQTFAWSDLLNDYDTIRLVRKVIELDEVVVTWRDHIRTVGTTRITKGGGVCGWGGTDFGRGHELGLLMELGDETVKIEDINLKVHKQSFDTVVFRLHIRSIENGLPSVELLTENIYLPLFEQSGWQKADLSDYNILVKGRVALSIEWLKVSNVIEKNLIRMNGAKTATPNVLFNLNKKSGTFFIRKGSEAAWVVLENRSPGFFVTVKE